MLPVFLTMESKLVKLSPLMLTIGLTSWTRQLCAAVDEPTGNVHYEVAQRVEFNSLFLNRENSGVVDLSRFSNGAMVTPGTYNVAVYVNDRFITNSDVTFRQSTEGTMVSCIDNVLLKQLPLKYQQIKAVLADSTLDSKDACIRLPKEITGVSEYFDSNEQKLYFSVPQIAIEREAEGGVNPALWDSGIPVGILGYTVNEYSSESQGHKSDSFYARLQAGFNIGSWYLRHNGSYSQGQGQSGYDSSEIYLQHDVPAVSGRLLIGQSATTGMLFDSLPFTGIQFSSDDRMLPASQRGYAPEIHGIARTNARVKVSQNGRTILELTVSPGEFLINDLYPSGYGGDLDVSVYEADGSVHSFSVPYSSIAQLLRPGNDRYALTGGRLSSPQLKSSPNFYQLTYQRGLSNLVTAYGGAQAGNGYYSVQGGAALGTVIGAFSFDVTQATHEISGAGEQRQSGQSYRVSYSKMISRTNSQVSLAAYRFSSSGYLDFLSAMQARESANDDSVNSALYRLRNRYVLSLAQSLPTGWGQAYLSGSEQSYWGARYKNRQYQLGYSNSFSSVSYGITAGRSYDNQGKAQDSVMLSLFFPFGSGESGGYGRPTVRLQAGQNSSGQSSEQAMVSGTLGSDSQFNYGLMLGNTEGEGASTSVSGQYTSRYTALSASYGSTKSYRSYSAGLTGSMVAHSGGLTLSPYLSDTFALVEARGAKGAKIASWPGIYVDSQGYALVPGLSPYQFNSIIVDPGSEDVEFVNTEQKVAPYFGAVVKVKYATHQGTPILIHATLPGDEPLPFGADVLDEAGRLIGAVGQGGQAYARVDKDRGTLTIRWGETADKRCELTYQLLPVAKNQQAHAMQTFYQQCQSPAVEGQKSRFRQETGSVLLSMN